MQVTLTVRCPDGVEHDIEVRSRGSLTVAQLAEGLSEVLGTPPLRLRSDGAPLVGDLLIGGPGLRDGARLSCAADGARRQPVPSALELRVISGPDCGLRIPLSRSDYSIGRSDAADISIRDPDISRLHAAVRVGTAGLTISDLGSTNGTLLNGALVCCADTTLRVGALFRLGNSVLTLTGDAEPPAATTPGDDGSVVISRPPRFEQPVPTEVVEFPSVDSSLAGRPRTQWLAALLPAVLGVALAAVMRNVQFLAFAVLSPISVGATMLSDRRSWRRGRKAANIERSVAHGAATLRLQHLLAAETERRRYRHPDASSVARTAATVDCRLWERSSADADFLSVRLGCADLPAHVQVSGRSADEPPPIAPFVPVVVSLKSGALGIYGPDIYATGVARWLIAQALTAHSPRELTLYALLDDHDSAGWHWLRWTQAHLSTTATQNEAALQSVAAIVTARRQQRSTGDEPWTGGWTLVLIDPVATVIGSPDLATVLRDGPGVGVTVLCTAPSATFLPRDCRSVVGFGSASGNDLRLSVAGEHPTVAVGCERVSADWAEALGRDLAPLRDADPSAAGAIGSDARLLDLLDLDAMSPDALLGRWRANIGPRTAIGLGATGPLEIDLVRDGPHALIAGTTGSGKSELLRSLVAGLASNNSPDAINFILIDYKGGAAFAECADLPHTVAVVTDLDSHLTARALLSLEAELKRREAAFAMAGVTDLSGYQSSTPTPAVIIPRLVLVVDEFAALAEELPDFISGLVGIAQRGRSLGVHLILATQRPSGVVSAEIKANMALRIALRVIDPAESCDVIGTSAAAVIAKSTPGRAHAQLAGGLTEFQTARVGLPVPDGSELTLTLLDRWNRRPVIESEPGKKTDLDLLRDSAREAANRLSKQTLQPVWLPPLPERLGIERLTGGTADPFTVAFGLADLPARQCQPVLAHDLRRGGSLGFIGGPRSGRSGALRTIAALSAAQLGTALLSIQVIDCAGGSLRALSDLDCCASFVGLADFEAIARLLQRLEADLERRQAILTTAGFSSVQEAAERGQDYPVVVVVLDGWDGFSASSDAIDSGRSVDAVLRLLRDGPAAGFTIVLAGDRALLGVRIGALVRSKFVLALTDPGDYAAAAVSARDIPAVRTPGRGVTAGDGTQFQLVTLGSGQGAADEWAAISAITAAGRDEPRTPSVQNETAGFSRVSVRALPRTVAATDLAGSATIVLGVGGDDATPVAVDSILAAHSRFLIAGAARSGRSSTSRLIARQAVAARANLLVAAAARSPLLAWARQANLPVLVPSDDALPMPAQPRGFGLIVIDDAEAFTDTTAGALITQLMESTDVSVVASARSEDLLVSFRGIAVGIRREGVGLLLGAAPADGELLGIAVPRRRGATIAGRGLLVTHELRTSYPDGMPVQVAVD